VLKFPFVASTLGKLCRAGRITAGCNGLWLDAQIPQLKRITDFLHRFGSAAGMQLAHSGWKGSTRRPWHGGTRLDDEDVKLRGEHSWPIVSVGDESFDGEMPGPAALTILAYSGLLTMNLDDAISG
jgi:2,4-dienoyl-CoA reductase-like NADH-dependent reductase (Old Yellow Enzyme family)